LKLVCRGTRSAGYRETSREVLALSGTSTSPIFISLICRFQFYYVVQGL
jgi:hypothetical protein